MVKTVVGLPEAASTTRSLAKTVRTQQREIDDLRVRLEQLESLVERLATGDER
jgi:hypothetical protein